MSSHNMIQSSPSPETWIEDPRAAEEVKGVVGGVAGGELWSGGLGTGSTRCQGSQWCALGSQPGSMSRMPMASETIAEWQCVSQRKQGVRSPTHKNGGQMDAGKGYLVTLNFLWLTTGSLLA